MPHPSTNDYYLFTTTLLYIKLCALNLVKLEKLQMGVATKVVRPHPSTNL